MTNKFILYAHRKNLYLDRKKCVCVKFEDVLGKEGGLNAEA